MKYLPRSYTEIYTELYEDFILKLFLLCVLRGLPPCPLWLKTFRKGNELEGDNE